MAARAETTQLPGVCGTLGGFVCARPYHRSVSAQPHDDREEHVPPASGAAITAAVGALALVTAGVLIHGTGAEATGAVDIPCPFREMTGIPCPLCGATRSLGLLAQGDPSFLRYNPVWAVVVVLGIPAALLLAWRPGLRAAVARAPTALKVGVVVAVGVVAWAIALANRATIVGA